MIVIFVQARSGLLGFIEFGLDRYEQGHSSVVGFRLTMVRDGQGCEQRNTLYDNIIGFVRTFMSWGKIFKMIILKSAQVPS